MGQGHKLETRFSKKNERVSLKISPLNPTINKGKIQIKLRILEGIVSSQENNVFSFNVSQFFFP